MTVHDRIEINPKIMLGKPVIRGTRIPVELIVRKMAEGADENCDFSVVMDLRLAGCDVVSIMERMAGASDETVVDFARSERRLLLREEKDLGQLVFAAAKQNSGVILTRYPASARAALSAAVPKLLPTTGKVSTAALLFLNQDVCELLSL
jgi:hypothetical protein